MNYRKIIMEAKVMKENQNDGEFSAGASLVVSSEASAKEGFSGLPTQKEVGEANSETTNILTLRGESGLPTPRGLTGPGTGHGKKRSNQNALKSGIFSRATLLKGESTARYQSLLQGLCEVLKPIGKLEELLIEKLATISWRYRRLLIAEGAEIRKYTEFLQFGRRQLEQQEADEISQKRQLGGIDGFTEVPIPFIFKIQNSNVLKRCLELLVGMRQEIKANGLNWDRDSSVLERIYGDTPKVHLRPNLYDEYWSYCSTARLPESERQSRGYATPEQCKQYILGAVNGEITRLKQFEEERESIECERTEVEILRQSVPDSRGLDRLLRYENSLERALDRTLMQLERAQRVRKGQPLPPQVDVKIS
jgi:hypothetical protein